MKSKIQKTNVWTVVITATELWRELMLNSEGGGGLVAPPRKNSWNFLRSFFSR
jgi:hypothetical protein